MSIQAIHGSVPVPECASHASLTVTCLTRPHRSPYLGLHGPVVVVLAVRGPGAACWSHPQPAACIVVVGRCRNRRRLRHRCHKTGHPHHHHSGHHHHVLHRSRQRAASRPGTRQPGRSQPTARARRPSTSFFPLGSRLPLPPFSSPPFSQSPIIILLVTASSFFPRVPFFSFCFLQSLS